MLNHVEIRTLDWHQLGLDMVLLEEVEGILAVVHLTSVLENREAKVIHHGLDIS